MRQGVLLSCVITLLCSCLLFLFAGTLHTHVLAWKVDLDIAGTQNSLNMLHFKVRGYLDPGLLAATACSATPG